MSDLATLPQTNEQQWQNHAQINAEHRAQIFIDAGNPEKVALALKEVPYKRAMIFLYELGKKYLHHHDKRAQTCVHASELMERKTVITKETKHEHVPLSVIKRRTVAEIFAEKI